MMRIYLTGEVCLESSRALIREDQLPRRQGRLAFAYLVCERQRAVGRDELAEVIWPDRMPSAWDGAVSALVSKLRALLAQAGLDRATAISSAFGCYQLRLPVTGWVDIEAAIEAVHSAEGALRAGSHLNAYGPAVVAGAILRRPFLPGEEGAWVAATRDLLRAHLIRALDCLVDLHRWNREPALALQVAEEAVRLDPLRETGYQGLMRAHLAAGDRAGVVRAYMRCRRLLADELGTVPAAETDAVYQQVAGITAASRSRRRTI